MAIKEFEFMHGGVITRLLRKDIPLQLTLVETSSNDSKAVYKILSQNNNELTLYIKYRSRPEPRKKEGWGFPDKTDSPELGFLTKS
jgi:activator of HSP90 ATPase